MIHGIKIPEDCTLVICGSRNAGKTTLFTKLLFNLEELVVTNKRGIPFILKTADDQNTEDYKIDFDNILIYAKNPEQFLYQFIKHGIGNKIKFHYIGILIEAYFRERLDEEEIEELCRVYAEQNPEHVDPNMNINVLISANINDFVLRKLNKKNKNLFIMDDCSEDKNQEVQTDFFQSARHFNCTCIYLTHRFHTPGFQKIRTNTSAFILFEQNQKVLEQLYRDINIPMTRKEFYAFAKAAWSKGSVNDVKKYLYFNNDTKELLVSPF